MWFNPASRTGGAPLDPFHQDTRGTSWTSNACRDWKTSLKYDYDDFAVPQSGVGSAALLSITTSSTTDSEAEAPLDLSALKKRINEKYGVVRRQLHNSPSIDGHENDYVINIIYDRYDHCIQVSSVGS
jgi:hypothetical protein